MSLDTPTTATRLKRALAPLLVCGVVLAASGCGGDDDTSGPPTTDTVVDGEAAADRTSEPDEGSATTTTGAVPEVSQLSFAFTGEPGEAGCRYTGPPEVSTSISSTLTNESEGGVAVSLARLAAGATEADFLAHLAELGDSYPVIVPPGLANPAGHDWMQGDWLELHASGPGVQQGVERSALFEGDYVAFCFRDHPTEDGPELWPAGSLSVRG